MLILQSYLHSRPRVDGVACSESNTGKDQLKCY